MNLIGLVLLTLLFPAVWGWFTHRLVARCWPAAGWNNGPSARPSQAPVPLDYQI